LNILTSDCDKIRSQTNSTSLSVKSLIKVAKKYHELTCPGQECIIYEKNEPAKVRLTVFSGIVFVNGKAENIINMKGEGKFRAGINYNQGILIEIQNMPLFSENLSLFSGVIYQKENLYMHNQPSTAGSLDVVTIDYNCTYIKVPLGIKYAIIKKKIEPSISLGVCLFNRLHGDASYTAYFVNGDELIKTSETDLTINKSGISFIGGFSLLYNANKNMGFQLGLGYEYKDNLIDSNFGRTNSQSLALDFGIVIKL
jgi:hypothetical protein